MTRTLRCLFAVGLSLAVAAVTLPARANVPQPEREMSCCVKMPKHDGDSPACPMNKKPGQAPDRQCCPACWLALAIAPAAESLRFSPDRGEAFPSNFLARSARADRPPVPPPR